jgi:hypothetical protein
MITTYGVQGSGTYAVSFPDLDSLMSVFKDNTTNDISAFDSRNALLTLFNNSGGGSFSYTQTAPLSQVSTIGVGGIPSGITFSNLPLQQLFDRMFFPAQPSIFNISASPTSIEIGRPNPTVTVTVNLTKRTPTYISANVSGGSGNTFTPTPPLPSDSVPQTTISYPNINVSNSSTTTFTLTINDGQIRTDSASVNVYFPRWIGTVNINAVLSVSTDIDSKDLTQSQKNNIISYLQNGVDWGKLWGSSNNTHSFTERSSQLSNETVNPVNLPSGSHIIFVFPTSDYGGNPPSSYKFGGNLSGAQSAQPVTSLTLIGVTQVRNRHGVERECRIFIDTFKSTAQKVVLIS